MTGAWLALVSALVLTAFGQMSFKLFFITRRYAALLTALVLFALAPVCSYFALRQLGIGTVYISTAVTQILVLGLSRLILKEQLTFDHLVAMVLITTGVVIFAWQT
jgi:multidrug transporter EmrE-like cation transporter